jgi:hypothetical protein
MHDGNDDRGPRNRDMNATSTEKVRGNGIGKGGMGGFLRWIFGLPDSTTVGDIRAQMAATSTAGTPHAEAGFWARIFGSFHFGGNKDN